MEGRITMMYNDSLYNELGQKMTDCFGELRTFYRYDNIIKIFAYNIDTEELLEGHLILVVKKIDDNFFEIAIVDEANCRSITIQDSGSIYLAVDKLIDCWIKYKNS